MRFLGFDKDCRDCFAGVAIAFATLGVFWACLISIYDLASVHDAYFIYSMASEREQNLEKFKNEDHSAFVVGYTGETGKEIVKELNESKPFKRVVLIGRRQTNITEKLGKEFEERVVDFDNLDQYKEAFEGCDVGFNALGTTRGKSGVEGFVKVDNDYVMKTAEIAKTSGCKHFIHSSSQGTDKNSSFLYPRIKGQVEESLKVLHFERLSIFRPGILICDREESRPGETVLRTVLKPIFYFFPTAISTPTEMVARAMVNNAISAPSENKTELFENKAIHMLAGNLKPKPSEMVKPKKKTESQDNQEL
ncbi:oxidoreductase HTATIP2-like isoform X1 [Saccostrea cucullata]|uniref:oxidoreductase HTATIP2-like isoform X1 n=2 Tax=Saccostrea cuccullata TaxID=36930 RepID=UPI002ED5ECEF